MTDTDLLRIESQKRNLPEEDLIQSEEEAAIWNALKKLDERHRMEVHLRRAMNLRWNLPLPLLPLMQ